MSFEKGKISTALGNYRNEVDIKIYDETESTNKLAKESNYTRDTLFIAHRQSAGRGRLGRSFLSPDGGIYMSLGLHPDIPIEKSVMITPMTAVAVCRAIASLTNLSPEIKWVNDIFAGGKKICGILTEAVLRENILTTVVGIGINVVTPADGFHADIKDIAGALFESSADLPNDLHSLLAGAVVREFLDLYHKLPKCDFIEEYRRLCFVIGKNVTVISGDKRTPAHAFAIDENCRLGVRYQDGREEFLFGGEISIRL